MNITEAQYRKIRTQLQRINTISRDNLKVLNATRQIALELVRSEMRERRAKHK